MQRTVYINGEFLPESEAKISVFDRGFLFADAAYEVFPVIGGGTVELENHVHRMDRSLNEMDMTPVVTEQEYRDISKTLIEKNNITEGLIYLQVSRGVADRSFDYPETPQLSIVMFTQEKAVTADQSWKTGISVITTPDMRWKRCDIKTVGLLAASMAKDLATQKGADDAWLVDEAGFVTEGSSNNAYIINADGQIITRQLGNEILPGITRQSVVSAARQFDMEIIERPFTVEEALGASEAFITSASRFVMPVVTIDGKSIGNGKPGEITIRLREIYTDIALKSAQTNS